MHSLWRSAGRELCILLLVCFVWLGETGCPEGLKAMVSSSSNKTHCLCPLGQLCGGELCTHGRTPTEGVVVGFDATCKYCRCVAMTDEEKLVFRPMYFNRSRMYYHVHISKTGGTTFMHFLERVAPLFGGKMCEAETPPFTRDPYFAEPDVLAASGCTVASAEGRLRFWAPQFQRRPRDSLEIITVLRHPAMRTLSQWHHDKLYTRDRFPTLANLTDLYKTLVSELDLPIRYRNWYVERLWEPPLDGKEWSYLNIKQYAFIGITEYYQTTVCLFYFTFQLHKELAACQASLPPQYNHNCKTAKFHNPDCDGRLFANAAKAGPARHLDDQLSSVPLEVREQVAKHAPLDSEMYNLALALFWRRVALMARVTGMVFPELPKEYAVTSP